MNDDGSIISTLNYSTSQWSKAEVPSTVLGTLVSDNIYKDVYVGDNLNKIPTEQFQKPWWYRTEFSLLHNRNDKYVKLEFEGINYRATIWLNGKRIAISDSIYGSFRMFTIDVSKIINRNGKNVLAVEVFPPKAGEPSISFADWNPVPPDNNMRIFRPIKLKFRSDVAINYPFVKSKIDLKTLKSAALSVFAELVNNSKNKISGILIGEIGNIKFSKKNSSAVGKKFS